MRTQCERNAIQISDTDTDKDIKSTSVLFSRHHDDELKIETQKNEHEKFAIRIVMAGNQTHGITDEKIRELSEIYQGVDILTELKKMNLWLMDNDKRRSKSARGVQKRMATWIANSLDRVSKVPQCSINKALQHEIVNLYKNTLLKYDNVCPVNVWSSADAINMQERINKEEGFKCAEAWGTLFEHIATCEKLIGKQPLSNGNYFKLSLSYIVREQSFADICNGKWDN